MWSDCVVAYTQAGSLGRGEWTKLWCGSAMATINSYSQHDDITAPIRVRGVGVGGVAGSLLFGSKDSEWSAVDAAWS